MIHPIHPSFCGKNSTGFRNFMPILKIWSADIFHYKQEATSYALRRGWLRHISSYYSKPVGHWIRRGAGHRKGLSWLQWMLPVDCLADCIHKFLAGEPHSVTTTNIACFHPIELSFSMHTIQAKEHTWIWNTTFPQSRTYKSFFF